MNRIGASHWPRRFALTALAIGSLATIQPAPAAASCGTPLCAGAPIPLRPALHRAPDDNVLKLFSSAVDDTRHRLYVAGAMTAPIAVYDTVADAFVGTVDSGVAGELTHKYLFMDEAANGLWIADATRQELRHLDLDTGTLAGPVVLGPFFGNAVVDSARHRLIVTSSESPTVRAFDSNLTTAWASTALGMGTGPVVLDASADLLYVLDIAARGTSRPIHRLQASNGVGLSDLTYTAELNSRSVALDRDPANGRFWVGNDRGMLVVGAAGGTTATLSIAGYVLEDELVDAEHGRYVALLSANPAGGEVDHAESRIWAFDRDSLAKVADLAVGRKAHRMTLSADRDAVFLPNGDASTVWRVPTTTYASATAIRLGDSLEGIVPAADGRTVYTTSRLGGSYLAAVDTTSGQTESFDSGTWPYPILGDSVGETLYVLDFWDSNLSVFDLVPTRSLRARIPLGLPRGTTDRLPDLAVDEARQLAFAALPELGKVAVVDLAAEVALAALTVPAFPAGEEGGGPGDLQLAVDGDRALLYVLASDQQKLYVFDLAAGRSLKTTVDLHALDWGWAGLVADRNSLFVDLTGDVLFVGPHELAATTGQPTGRRLAGNRQVIGRNGDGRYWIYGGDEAAGVVTYQAVLADPGSLATVESPLALGAAGTLAYVPLYDPRTDTLWVGNQVAVTLTPWTVDGGAAVGCVADAAAVCLQGNRFRLSAAYQAPGQAAGAAHAVALTADTGYLWFFAESNVEVVVKVLDGRGVNGAFWVFAGPLSNVAYTLTIEDTVTGERREYSNLQGAVSVVTDTSAFPAP